MAAETLAEGPTPEARIGHTAVYDPDSRRIFVFGGSKNRKWFNDVHILDTQTWKWTMVEVPKNPIVAIFLRSKLTLPMLTRMSLACQWTPKLEKSPPPISNWLD